MNEVSILLRDFFLGKSEFTNVFGQRLYALAAPSNVTWPFATFSIIETKGLTKDADDYDITIGLFFKQDKYSECVQACDALKPIIRSSAFDWVSSEPDVNEDLTYVGIINLKITK